MVQDHGRVKPRPLVEVCDYPPHDARHNKLEAWRDLQCGRIFRYVSTTLSATNFRRLWMLPVKLDTLESFDGPPNYACLQHSVLMKNGDSALNFSYLFTHEKFEAAPRRGPTPR